MSLASEDARRFPRITSAPSPLSTTLLVCLVVALSYLAPKLEGAMMLNPRTVWPVWPGCAILVSILLLVPGRVWPILIPAAFATFALYDLEVGVPIKSIAWFIPANTIQVLTSALCLRYCFQGIPRLNSVKALAKYSFFAVILAPCFAAFFSASGIEGSYWDGWRVCFLSEALAFVTLTPAILSWFSEGPAFVRKPRAYRLEALALITGLILLSYAIFDASGRGYSPALLYSLIPFLLWAALRFGSIGISSSAVLVSFITIWGAVHARGPFADQGSLNGMLSVQLFLVFAALPFMVLAAVVEERKHAEEALRNSEERFHFAAQAGRMFAYEWDAATDVIVRSSESTQILGIGDTTRVTGQQILTGVHPDDRDRLLGAVAVLTPEKPHLQISYRIVRPDGSVIWVERNSRAHFDEQGRMLRIVGMVADIADRKLAEEALASVSRRLIAAQEHERTRIARELHDDIGQRLALLAIKLEQLNLNAPDLSPEVRSRMSELQKHTTDLATDIQSLSHELHSSKLESLGIAAAIRGFCKEFGEQQKVEIDFKNHDLPSPLPPDISLCLFRVLQEALHNSAKHSGVRRSEVRLWGASGEIHLTVSDGGSGFDSEAAKEGRGLGLISMEERLKALNGTFSIESQAKRGTTVHARVPLSSDSKPIRAAG